MNLFLRLIYGLSSLIWLLIGFYPFVAKLLELPSTASSLASLVQLMFDSVLSAASGLFEAFLPYLSCKFSNPFAGSARQGYLLIKSAAMMAFFAYLLIA